MRLSSERKQRKMFFSQHKNVCSNSNSPFNLPIEDLQPQMSLISYVAGIFSFIYKLALRLVNGNTRNTEERVVRAVEPNGTVWNAQSAIDTLNRTVPAGWLATSVDEPNPQQPQAGAGADAQLAYRKALGKSRRVRQEDFLTHLSAEQHPGVEALWCVHGLGSTPYSLLFQVEMVGRALRVMPNVVIERLLYLVRHHQLPNQYILGYCGMAPLMWVMQDLGVSNAIHTRLLVEGGIDDPNLEYRTRIFNEILNTNGAHRVQFTCQKSTTQSSMTLYGSIMGGMSQTAVAYLSLTRGKVKYISWLRDLLFPQMSEPLIILLEFKDLPQDNPSNYFLALAARLLPTKGLPYAQWVANQQDIQNVAQNLVGDFLQPHSNRAAFTLLRYLISEGRLNVQAVLIGMHSRSTEPNVANTVQEFVTAMQAKNIPVFYDLPVGHVQPNYPVPFGKSKLELNGSVLRITSNESTEDRYARMLINPAIYVLLFLLGALTGFSVLATGVILVLSLIVQVISLKFITALLFVSSAFLPIIAIPGNINRVPRQQLMILLAMIISPCVLLHYFEPVMTNGTALISLIILVTLIAVAVFSFENSGLRHPRPHERHLQWIISTWCCLIIPAMALSFVEAALVIALHILPSSTVLSTATGYLCIGIVGLIFILNCVNVYSPLHQLFGKIAAVLHFVQRKIIGSA